jgi:hypothetical protein
LINDFLAWAEKDPLCDITCEFIAGFLNKEVITSGPSTPGGVNPKQPIARIMEQLGSKNNKSVFRLLRNSVNTLKGDVCSFLDHEIFLLPELH